MSLLRVRVAALAAAGAMLVGLSACAPEPVPKPEPAPSESAAPIFASDEEALAAAVAAYEAYLAQVDALTAAGGAHADRIREFVTTDYAVELEESLARLSESGNKTSGASTADRFELIEYRELDQQAEVSIYVCLDASGVRVLDSTGVDVTPADRVERRPLQVALVSDPDEPQRLLPSGSETWPGDDFC